MRVLGKTSGWREGGGGVGQGRDDDHLPKLQAREHDATTKVSQVILVGPTNALDKTVNSEPLEASGDPGGLLPRQVAMEVLVPQTADRELAADDGRKNEVVVGREEVEATVVAPVLGRGLSDLPQRLGAGARILQGGDERQVADVGGGHQFAQVGQAVDASDRPGRR